MRRSPWLSLLACCGTIACTDAGLQPHQNTGSGVDDLLEIQADLCTTPAVDAYFPVKILFVVDTSDSMTVTDRQGIRAQAVAQVLNRYAGNPSVEFGVIAFDSKIDILTPGFTNTPDIASITQRLSQADRLTDYQGALGAAYTMLATDMQQSNPADRARTKYVVMFFSDGTPDPQCSAEVTPCGTGSCQPGTVCKVGMCQMEFLVCTVPKEDWQNAFNPPLDPSLYPQLMAGGDYNLPQQIYRSVDDIVQLQDFYRVGEVRLHTGFLFDPNVASDPLAGPFLLDHDAGAELLSNMAQHGNGTYTEFSSGTQINFLNIDYTSIKEQSSLAELIISNSNALPAAKGPLSDTDGDGIDDDTEFALQTCIGLGPMCADPTDSDGDGYNDKLEDANRAAGFDPLDPMKPSLGCARKSDSDGDGLRDCEEQFLGTDPRLFDSDGDRMTDLQEVLVGLNPLDPSDAQADDDHDGIRNIDEIQIHTDPHHADVATGDSDPRYRYDAQGMTNQTDGSICYSFTIRNVKMLTTGKGTSSVLGKNRIWVYFDQAPSDRPLDYGELRVACVDTRYVNGVVKAPASGIIHLTNKDLVKPTQLDPTTDCIDLTSVAATNPDGGM